jgi:quercetin dioxygenase-like cupin family protein
MTQEKIFTKAADADWIDIDFLPGVQLSILAEPVTNGSIHKAKLAKGTVIPVHTHPADEYVLVQSGTIRTTGGEVCEKGDFWFAPAGLRQGPHEALTDVELLTIRLGKMGEFEKE